VEAPAEAVEAEAVEAVEAEAELAAQLLFLAEVQR